MPFPSCRGEQFLQISTLLALNHAQSLHAARSVAQGMQVRLTEQAPTPKLGQPLNGSFAWVRQARPAAQVSLQSWQHTLRAIAADAANF